MVLVRHTYNLVDLPIMVAGKSGRPSSGRATARAACRSTRGSSASCPKDPRARLVRRRPTRSSSSLAFAYDSRTKGNAATEIVKYYLQLHFGIKKDYRNFQPPQARQLLPEQLMGVIRAEPARITDWAGQVRRGGLARVRPPAGDLRRPARRDRPGDGLHEQRRAGLGAARGAARRSAAGLMWTGIALIVVRRRDRVRLPLAQDVRLAALRPPARPARPDARDRPRRRRIGALGLDRAARRSSSASSPRS